MGGQGMWARLLPEASPSRGGGAGLELGWATLSWAGQGFLGHGRPPDRGSGGELSTAFACSPHSASPGPPSGPWQDPGDPPCMRPMSSLQGMATLRPPDRACPHCSGRCTLPPPTPATSSCRDRDSSGANCPPTLHPNLGGQGGWSFCGCPGTPEGGGETWAQSLLGNPTRGQFPQEHPTQLTSGLWTGVAGSWGPLSPRAGSGLHSPPRPLCLRAFPRPSSHPDDDSPLAAQSSCCGGRGHGFHGAKNTRHRFQSVHMGPPPPSGCPGQCRACSRALSAVQVPREALSVTGTRGSSWLGGARSEQGRGSVGSSG